MKNGILVVMAMICISLAACSQSDKSAASAENLAKEAVVCDTGENNCSVTCSSGCCLAIYWPDTKECTTSCECGKSRQSHTKKLVPFDKNAKIVLIAKNIKLSRIARTLNNIKGYQILIPADKADNLVSVSIKNISLSNALKSLGLRLSEQK